ARLHARQGAARLVAALFAASERDGAGAGAQGAELVRAARLRRGAPSLRRGAAAVRRERAVLQLVLLPQRAAVLRRHTLRPPRARRIRALLPPGARQRGTEFLRFFRRPHA